MFGAEIKNDLKEHIKISHLKTKPITAPTFQMRRRLFRVVHHFSWMLSSVFSHLRVSWQMGASDSRWCLGARPVWGWTEDCSAGRARRRILHHLRGTNELSLTHTHAFTRITFVTRTEFYLWSHCWVVHHCWLFTESAHYSWIVRSKSLEGGGSTCNSVSAVDLKILLPVCYPHMHALLWWYEDVTSPDTCLIQSWND